MLNMRKIFENFKVSALMTFSILVLSSCNKDFPNLLKEDYGSTDVSISKNKVLLVVVDGLRGEVLTDLEPENLRVIARNALYTNSSLADYATENFTQAIGLANLFTGVHPDVHKVSSDLGSIDLQAAPTFVTRLKANDSEFTSEAYTTSAVVSSTLLKDVDKKEVVINDIEVVNKTKSTIATTESSLVISHLSNPYVIGEANSYETNDIKYVEAIGQLDVQVGELINSLKSRTNYANENWVVILTSSIGGEITADQSNTDNTVFGKSIQNTFTYFYSPKFGRKYIAKPSTKTIPFSGAGMRLLYSTDGVQAMAARLDDASKLNIAGNESATITFFFKQNVIDQVNNYPALFMKRPKFDDGAVPGWQVLMSGGKAELGHNGSGKKLVTKLINDGKWHVVTAIIDRTNNRSKIYTDGELSDETNAGTSNLTNTFPLMFGRHPGSEYNTGDFTVCNFQFYNIAFSDEDVRKYSGLAMVKPDNSPYYNNLQGYWPMYNDNGKAVLTDVSGKAGNMTIINKSSWSTFDELVPFIIPDINESTFKLVPNLIDIPLFIYQWFGVLPQEQWQLKGQAWTPPYKVFEY